MEPTTNRDIGTGRKNNVLSFGFLKVKFSEVF